MRNGNIFKMTMLDNNSNDMNEAFQPSDLKVTACLNGNMPRTIDYDFYIYDETYTLMGWLTHREQPSAYTYNKHVLEVCIPIRQMWMAGKYMLLMTCQHGDQERVTWKADFMLDQEGMNLTFIGEERCTGITPERTLARYFNKASGHSTWFRIFNEIPGIFPIKCWVIQTKQWEWADEVLKKGDANPILFSNNFLITAETDTYASQTLTYFRYLAFRDYTFTTLYCDSLYDASNVEDPYGELHLKFPKNDGLNILSTFRSFNEKKFYAILEPGILSTKEGTPIRQAILQNAMDYKRETVTVIYGTKAEIDNLLEVEPAFRKFFNASNRAEVGMMTPAEMVHFFFWMAKTRNLYFNREAALHLRQLVTEAYASGAIRHWTRDHVHDYVDNLLRPRVTERMLREIATGKEEDDERAALIHKEDLDEDGILYPSGRKLTPVTLEDYFTMVEEPQKIVEEDETDEEEFTRMLDEFVNSSQYNKDDDLDSIDEMERIEAERKEKALMEEADEWDHPDDEDEDDGIDWDDLPDFEHDDDTEIPDGDVEQGANTTVHVEVLKPLKHPEEELDKLVGCADIRKRMEELTELSRYNRMMQCLNPHGKRHRVALHSLFLGRPGTGKTTVCKIFGSMLKEAGVLTKGHVVVCGRNTFIGTNWGDEEKVVRQVVEKAQGGVLMVDEAYLLNSDNKNDPGKLVIPLLMDVLADESQRNIAIVLCGYKEEMNRLMELNPGLNSRFPNRFEFPDFSIEELLEITRRRVGEYDYEFTRAAWAKYKALIADAYKVRDLKTWGNARFVANQLDRIYINHAHRCVRQCVSDRRHLFQITPADIQPIDVPTAKPRIGF